MPSNTTEVRWDVSQPIDSLKQLIKLQEDLNALIVQGVKAWLSGGAMPEGLRQNLQALSGAQTSAGVAKASMAPGGGGGYQWNQTMAVPMGPTGTLMGADPYAGLNRFAYQPTVGFSPSGSMDPTMAYTKSQAMAAVAPSPPSVSPFSAWLARSSESFADFRSQHAWTFGFMRGAGVAVGEAGINAIQAGTEQIVTGRPNIMQQAQTPGMLIGGLGGAAIGSVFGGFGSIIGAHIGSQLGGLVSQRFAAGDEVKAQTAVAALQMGISAANIYGTPYERSVRTGNMNNPWSNEPYGALGIGTFPGGAYHALRMENWASGIREAVDRKGVPGMGFGSGIGPSKDVYQNLLPSQQEIMAGASTVYSGLIQGGIDPEGRSGTYATTYPWINQRDRYLQGYDKGRPSLLDVVPRGAGYALSSYSMDRVPETNWQMYTRRAEMRWLRSAQDILKTVQPVFGTLPETGGNIADILGRFGATTTARYAELLVEPNQMPSVDEKTLLHASAGVRGAERAAAFGSTRARGSAMEQVTAYSTQQTVLGALPGGRESLAYAETHAKLRDSIRAAFDQSNMVSFGVPMAQLDAAQTILSSAPYAPGNQLALSAARMGLDRQQMGRIKSYYNARQRAGDLSEAEQLDLTRQYYGLEADAYTQMAQATEMSVGALPNLSAGRPAGFARLDSHQLAATYYEAAGIPRRGEGARSGRGLRMQNNWLRSAGMSDSDAGPHSRTEGINNQPGSSQTDAILLRILAAIEAGSNRGSGMRPGEARGKSAGNLNANSGGYDFDKGFN
jgi:hypothetical protein